MKRIAAIWNWLRNLSRDTKWRLLALFVAVPGAIWASYKLIGGILERNVQERVEITGYTSPYLIPPIEQLPKGEGARFLACTNATTVLFPNKTSIQLHKVVFLLPRSGYAARIEATDTEGAPYKIVKFKPFNGRLDIDFVPAMSGVGVIVWHAEKMKPGEHITIVSEETGKVTVPFGGELAFERDDYKVRFWVATLALLVVGVVILLWRPGRPAAPAAGPAAPPVVDAAPAAGPAAPKRRGRKPSA